MNKPVLVELPDKSSLEINGSSYSRKKWLSVKMNGIHLPGSFGNPKEDMEFGLFFIALMQTVMLLPAINIFFYLTKRGIVYSPEESLFRLSIGIAASIMTLVYLVLCGMIYHRSRKAALAAIKIFGSDAAVSLCLTIFGFDTLYLLMRAMLAAGFALSSFYFYRKLPEVQHYEVRKTQLQFWQKAILVALVGFTPLALAYLRSKFSFILIICYPLLIIIYFIIEVVKKIRG